MNNKRIDGKTGFPIAAGLYDPGLEKDSCGVGFVAHIKGVASHEIMTDAYHINSRMDHRGGCGFEENTGDGAGILTAMPHKFLTKVCAEIGITLPEPQQYSVGNIFLPHDEAERSTTPSRIGTATSRSTRMARVCALANCAESIPASQPARQMVASNARRVKLPLYRNIRIFVL